MNILTAHNYYQIPGGEDPCFEAEAELLKQNNHNITTYTKHNDAVKDMGNIPLLFKTLWNRDSFRDISDIILKTSADIVHFHNTFPLISPSAVRAAKKQGSVVVQSLHNYRLLCLNSYLARNGKVCDLCIDKVFKYPGIFRKCYRNDSAASAVTALMIAFHKMKGTWTREVDGFIALTEFAKKQLVKGGIPEQKIFIKPNFLINDPGEADDIGRYALFVGRLSEEKGVRTLLKAFAVNRHIPLKIAGSGPLENELKHFVQERKLENVEFLGNVPSSDLMGVMKKSRFLILPSECYETFSRDTITGLPHAYASIITRPKVS